MIARCNTGRAGFTLLEMLAVMWAMAVALSLGAVLMITILRSDRVSQATLRQLAWRSTAADQFRADVARAEDAPDAFAEFRRGPTCLILRLAGGHVIFVAAGEKLERIVRAADGSETRRAEPVGPPDSAVELDRIDGPIPILVLRLIDPPAAGPRRRLEIAAAFGGDRR